jgi:hypothetical protein
LTGSQPAAGSGGVVMSKLTNSEKVVKRFYAEFAKQHEAFLAFIKGMDDALPDKDNFNKKWYASLMMNRLMFCYFIQKKRFLDWNDNYLQDKLKACKKLKGADNFYGFYRSFLLELFHHELANPEEKRRKTAPPPPPHWSNSGIFLILTEVFLKRIH